MASETRERHLPTEVQALLRDQQIGRDEPDRHQKFRETLSTYYRQERDRAERCLADIVAIIADNSKDQQLDAILHRMIAYYSRAT